MEKTLISGATVVLPNETICTDVLIEGTKIADIDPAVQIRVDHRIDASSLHLIPGVIDDQVHFREPGLTHKEDIASGSRACAKGGITTFLEMPNTKPATINQQRLDEKLAIASKKSIVNYGFYIGATHDNVEELEIARRTPGIKIFIGSSTGDLLVDEQEALERIFAETTLPITAHCEDEATIRANAARIGTPTDVSDHSQIRDAAAAITATRRACELARRYRHRFHVLHVSTAMEADYLADHRHLITAEACPHHLFFHVGDYERLGTRVQANPSVKSQHDNQALWAALAAGRIQVIATDHAPHTLAEKDQPYPQSPSGVPCVENSLALMLNAVHDDRCTLRQVVDWMCTAPAKVWDIVNKGQITVGYDADLVLVDLRRTTTIHDNNQLTKCGWSPWSGRELTGWPVRTWVMGETVYQEGHVSSLPTGHEAVFDHQRGGYWS